MNSSDVRKFIKKGEQAVDVLESLGYQYVSNDRGHPHWVAPVNPLSDIEKAIHKLVEEGVQKSREGDLKGPQWDSVKGLKGRQFSVKIAKIPSSSKLSEYGSMHFSARLFTCLEVRYHRSETCTGYAVLFEFQSSPFNKETVWLPLSACVFSQ